MRLRHLAVALALPLTACSHSIEGPALRVTSVVSEVSPGVQPASVCYPADPSKPVLVDVLGQDFAPMPAGLLTGSPSVLLPSVTLTGPATWTAAPAQVSFASATRLVVSLPLGAAALPAGDYAVKVANASGGSASLTAALHVAGACPQLGALTVQPRFGWKMRNQPVSITNAYVPGTSLPFSGGAPAISIVATIGGVQQKIPLRNVAFQDPSTITAVIPDCSGLARTDASGTCAAGIDAGGPYAVEVTDPSGAEGTIASAFQVLPVPPPSVSGIVPASMTVGGGPLTVKGAFQTASNPKVQIAFEPSAGVVRACDLPSAGSATATALLATVPTTIAASSCTDTDAAGNAAPAASGFSIAAQLYVIRVQDQSDPAYADFSGLSVTNPSAKLGNGPTVSAQLQVGRADFPLVQATDDLGTAYLYALGGSDGVAPLSSVEVAPINLYGDLGEFHLLDPTRTFPQGPLGVGTAGTAGQARRGVSAVARQVTEAAPGGGSATTSYLYVLGGIDGSGNALSTVERAQVLRTADAPVITSSGPAPGALQAGTYYYRVSALLPSTDPRNPGGETLASDRESVTVGGGGVSLAWQCGATPLARYRIYRTVKPSAPAGSEILLADLAVGTDVTCAGSPAIASFTDAGAATPAGDAPLPPGALGRWISLPGLSVPRGQAAARLVASSTPGAADLYVAGGWCGGAGVTCPASVLASVDHAAFGAATDLAPSSFASSSGLTYARRRFALAFADATGAPAAFSSTSPNNTLDAWLVAVGGDAGTAAAGGGVSLASYVPEVAQVRGSGGALAPAFSLSSYNSAGLTLHGGWSEVAGNRLIAAGDVTGANLTMRVGQICNGGECTGASSFAGTLSAASIAYQVPSVGPRYLAGETLFRAYVYAAGGLPSDAAEVGASSPVAFHSVERITF